MSAVPLTGEVCERRHPRPVLARFCIRDTYEYRHYVCDRHLPTMLRELHRLGASGHQRVLVMDEVD